MGSGVRIAISSAFIVGIVATALAQLPKGVSPEWTDALEMGVEGQGWDRGALAHPYDRLPAHAQALVRKAVWGLAHNSAGLAVRFVTDSPQVFVRWTLRSPDFRMDHMPDTGISGVDLYARDGDDWRWVATGRVRRRPTNAARLVEMAPPGEHEYMLYLPLYNGIESLEIGVSPEHTVSAAPPCPEERRRPIVFYGTSITQGGCASRPGMAYPAILGRWLARPTVNLGFSGNGRMDKELADLLGEIAAAAYVLDCGANMTAEMISERTVPFIRRLREARPGVPIVLLETAPPQDAWFHAQRRFDMEVKDRLTRQAFEALCEAGLEDLVLLSNDDLIGRDGEATVDGVHFTDLGFMRMAEALREILGPLVE